MARKVSAAGFNNGLNLVVDMATCAPEYHFLYIWRMAALIFRNLPHDDHSETIPELNF